VGYWCVHQRGEQGVRKLEAAEAGLLWFCWANNDSEASSSRLFARVCRVCRFETIKGLPARVTPLTPAGGVITIVEVLRSGPRSWAPVTHRCPKGLVYKRDPGTILSGP
jgi:hypothetical protein